MVVASEPWSLTSASPMTVAPRVVAVDVAVGDAVGEENEGVAGLEAELAVDEFGAGDDAEEEIAVGQFGGAVLVQIERRRVAGVDVLDDARVGIETAEEQRHELRLRQILFQRQIELRDERGRIGIALGENAKRHLQPGHHQAGGDAFAADVADDEVHLSVRGGWRSRSSRRSPCGTARSCRRR